MKEYDVIVIGGGVIGLYTTLDLSTRGFDVLLLEKEDIASGTSGKFHGLLHSGGRYVVSDPEAARECAEENRILKNVARHCIEDTGGFFVAINKEEECYSEDFRKACKQNGIPYTDLDVEEALKLEPYLNPDAKVVVEVQDAILYAYRFACSLALTAKLNGASIRTYNEVIGLVKEGNRILGVKVLDRNSGRVYEERSKVTIVATGPWTMKILKTAEIMDVSMLLAAGTMVVLPQRFTKRVINRMRPPSDGDIVVPYGQVTILGTTAFVVEDPESYQAPEEDVNFLIEECSALVPIVKNINILRVYSSVRPLISMGEERDARKISRRFEVYDHEEMHGIHNLLTIIGGKATTARMMAEVASDTVCEKLGIRKECKTRNLKLVDPMDLVTSSKLSVNGDVKGLIKRALNRVGTIDEELIKESFYLISSLMVT